MYTFDYLVIGSGVAGLSYALKVAQNQPDARIAIVTKAGESESNTKYAQGGVAVVLDQLLDSFEEHIEDTLKAGDGLCDPDIVRLVVTEGPERLKELIEWGVDFDEKTEGTYDLGREGGHSKNRILHHKDITGLEIERTLLHAIHESHNISIFPHSFAIDLITQHHLKHNETTKQEQLQCYGAYVFDQVNEKIHTYKAKVTLLAAGGIGHVYQNTTNPLIATGDGIAMAYRAKARISHMEFIQFHPTALYQPGQSGSVFLISEAVRGFGAYLRTQQGERFMLRYDERGELASRDIVSRAIDAEMKKSGHECVYLDCRHLDPAGFGAHFPNILQKCKEVGIDVATDMIPVVPAAHYLCGGVEVDENGQSTLKNLYVAGESAQTGLHGGNRLASNSLLEALVFAHRCYLHSTETARATSVPDHIPDWDEEGTIQPEELILITHNRKELQALMSDYVGIIRKKERLDRAANRLKVLYEETEILYKKSKVSPQLFELRNLITVAHLIVRQSLERKENAGVFFKG